MPIFAEGLNFTLQFIDNHNGGGADFLIDDTTHHTELYGAGYNGVYQPWCKFLVINIISEDVNVLNDVDNGRYRFTLDNDWSNPMDNPSTVNSCIHDGVFKTLDDPYFTTAGNIPNYSTETLFTGSGTAYLRERVKDFKPECNTTTLQDAAMKRVLISNQGAYLGAADEYEDEVAFDIIVEYDTGGGNWISLGTSHKCVRGRFGGGSTDVGFRPLYRGLYAVPENGATPINASSPYYADSCMIHTSNGGNFSATDYLFFYTDSVAAPAPITAIFDKDTPSSNNTTPDNCVYGVNTNLVSCTFQSGVNPFIWNIGFTPNPPQNPVNPGYTPANMPL